MKNILKKPFLTTILTLCFMFTILSVPSKVNASEPVSNPIEETEDNGIMPLFDYIFNE